VPGLGSTGAESLKSRLSSSRLLLDGELIHHARRADLRLTADLGFERYGFTNAYGESVGNYGPAVEDSQALSAGLSGRIDVPWTSHQLISVIAELRLERRLSYDILRPTQSGLPSLRGLYALALADELRFFADRLGLIPALRLDGAASSLERGAMSSAASPPASDVFISPRLSARLRATDWLTLHGSAGRFVRFPTLLEQFGDGAFLLGQPALRPESAWGGDLGAALKLSRRRCALELEATFFGRRTTDLIAYVPAAFAASAVNLEGARILGAEARAAARVGSWLNVSVDYTFLDAVNLSGDPGTDGRQLPGRPRHQLDGRVELHRGPFRIYYALDYVDQIYRDPQNRNPIAGRVLHAMGAQVAHGRFTFRVDVENLADLRVVPLPLGGTLHQGETTPYPLVDFFDYPLPGRAIYATLALRQ
jgi:iron complex outermembrane receptor protein